MNPRGDNPDWRSLLRTHGPALALLARQRGLSHADAQDAVQEAFVRLWRRGAGVDDPAAYLFGCVRNVVADIVRSRERRKRRETVVASQTTQAEPSFAADAEHEELAARVQALLANLPEPQREVVVMKVWGGLTFAQIAAAMEESANTIASRYRYALAAMREALPTEMKT